MTFPAFLARALARLGDLAFCALGWACMALGGAATVPAEIWLTLWRTLP